MRNIEKIASDALRYALSQDKDSFVLGNLTHEEVAYLAMSAIGCCPLCGATTWVNIDCDLCNTCSDLQNKIEHKE